MSTISESFLTAGETTARGFKFQSKRQEGVWMDRSEGVRIGWWISGWRMGSIPMTSLLQKVWKQELLLEDYTDMILSLAESSDAQVMKNYNNTAFPR